MRPSKVKGTAMPNQRRNTRLTKVYGISKKQYERMFREQKKACKICGIKSGNPDLDPDLKFDLAVDHCHQTGRIRGLLCGKCNSGLAMFCDNIGLLTGAISYLKAFAQVIRDEGGTIAAPPREKQLPPVCIRRVSAATNDPLSAQAMGLKILPAKKQPLSRAQALAIAEAAGESKKENPLVAIWEQTAAIVRKEAVPAKEPPSATDNEI